MSISDIKRSVIPATSARSQQQDFTNKPFVHVVDNDSPENTENVASFEDEMDRHTPNEQFNGYDPLGQSTPLGVGWFVLDTIDNLVEKTLPPMDIHELNIRLKLKRQEDNLIQRLPPPTA